MATVSPDVAEKLLARFQEHPQVLQCQERIREGVTDFRRCSRKAKVRAVRGNVALYLCHQHSKRYLTFADGGTAGVRTNWIVFSLSKAQGGSQ